MKRGWWYRFSFLLFLVVLSVMVVIPSAFNLDKNSSYPVKSKINLGLDLQGGLYMILGIDFEKVYKDEIRNYTRKMVETLKSKGVPAQVGELTDTDPEDPKHTIVFSNEADLQAAKEKLNDYDSVVRLTDQEAKNLEYGLHKAIRSNIQEQAVSKSIEVIRNRIDEFGVTEPEITSQGQDRIIVQLPGVKDIERAKSLIGKTAKLEFKLVHDTTSLDTLMSWVDKAAQAGIKFEKGTSYSTYLTRLNEFLAKDLPKGHEIVFSKKTNKFTNEVESMLPYLVETQADITGDDLQDAFLTVDQEENKPIVVLNFKPAGATRFEEITGQNIQRRLAIILDGNVYSDPSISGKIGGGTATITLGALNYNDAMEQGRDIALVLRAGALPVQLDFEEQRIVGPSLGNDSVAKAKVASLIGIIIVFIFIMIYYRVSGVIAVTTLVLNLLFVVASLVAFEATLTLPGIAGIALTIGMAVDGNIVIYERIREELRRGAQPLAAVKGGFDSAFWTILDANVTTALAGLCLLNFGTGPIRGFAVTLLIGIVATVYTAYFVSRILFDFYMGKNNGKSISI